MKLWQKICTYSLILFLSIFVFSGMAMIEYNTNSAMERRIKLASNEQTGISSGLMRYVLLERVKESTRDGEHDRKYIEAYLDSRISAWGCYLEIRDQKQVLYSNLGQDISDLLHYDEIQALSEYRRLSLGEKEYLVLTSMIPLKNRTLQNTYILDISDIYIDRIQQYSFFMKLTLAVSVLLSSGMYFIARHLTKSLRLLTESVIKIGNGNYSERIPAIGKDEAGRLTESYNQMAEAIEEKIRELEKKNRAQERFIDNFTHELRTPLTAVVGYADLLRSAACGEEDIQELGGYIFKEGKRIEKLSEMMMDLVFLKRHSFELKPCELGILIGQASDMFRPAAEKLGIELKVQKPEQPLKILAEKDLILNLLGNLLDNAGKASEEGAVIWLFGGLEHERAFFSVEDRGRGIPETDRERIFECFYMADKVRSGRNRGVGLGLSICSDIVKIHNGEIKLTSEVGKGTTIKIYFTCYNDDTMLP